MLVSTPSGPGLVCFFEDLFKLKDNWLNAIAKVEAFRSHDRFLYKYYVYGRDIARTAYGHDAQDLGYFRYEKECKEYAIERAAGELEVEEKILTESEKGEEANLLACKTSREMWHRSGILWAVTRRYEQMMWTTYEAAEKTKQDQGLKKREREASRRKAEKLLEEEKAKKRKADEILRKREGVKQKVQARKGNAAIEKRQMGTEILDESDLRLAASLQEWLTRHAFDQGLKPEDRTTDCRALASPGSHD